MQQMTESDKDLIIRMYNNRHSVSQIVRMLPYKEGTSMRFVRELRDTGFLKKENRQQSMPRHIVIKNLHDEGYNPYEISEQTGYVLSTIYQVLSDLKISRPRPKHNYKKRERVKVDNLSERTQQILTAVKDGQASGEICREFNISRQYLSQLKKKYLGGNV